MAYAHMLGPARFSRCRAADDGVADYFKTSDCRCMMRPADLIVACRSEMRDRIAGTRAGSRESGRCPAEGDGANYNIAPTLWKICNQTAPHAAITSATANNFITRLGVLASGITIPPMLQRHGMSRVGDSPCQLAQVRRACWSRCALGWDNATAQHHASSARAV